MHASNPEWYNAAFTEFLNRNEEGLMYAASYGIKGFEIERDKPKDDIKNVLKALEDIKKKINENKKKW